MTRNELEAAKKYIDNSLANSILRPSSSPVALLVIIIKKSRGGLRFYVDYRALNAVTIKNRYSIPKIRETLNKLSRTKYFTKFDIISVFN